MTCRTCDTHFCWYCGSLAGVTDGDCQHYRLMAVTAPVTLPLAVGLGTPAAIGYGCFLAVDATVDAFRETDNRLPYYVAAPVLAPLTLSLGIVAGVIALPYAVVGGFGYGVIAGGDKLGLWSMDDLFESD